MPNGDKMVAGVPPTANATNVKVSLLLSDRRGYAGLSPGLLPLLLLAVYSEPGFMLPSLRAALQFDAVACGGALG